jgi:glucoamylase
MSTTLESWIERQRQVSAAGLARAISATDLVYERRGFGQSIRPAKGSVLASPEVHASGPDYFFHWLRDAAAVMDAVLILVEGRDADAWAERFEDWLRFTLALGLIDGRRFLARGDVRKAVQADCLRYVRPAAEIAAVAGTAVLDDVRYNADGTLDFIHWGRPQHDGAPYEALVALRCWRRKLCRGEAARALLGDVIHRGLDYAAARAGMPCYDIWEEELGRHYYPSLLQWTALEEGAFWSEEQGESGRARDYRAAAARLAPDLDGFWCPDRRFYRSRLEHDGASPKALDMSVLLALVHAGRASGPHSIADPRARETVARLEAMFAADYPLNRAAARPFAFGRYRGDKYFSGGAWYLASFAAAEFHYRRAALEGRAALARGDEVLEGVRAYVPDSGALSEQFDQTTGAQTSAKNLAWSYAAFITAANARTAALAR